MKTDASVCNKKRGTALYAFSSARRRHGCQVGILLAGRVENLRSIGLAVSMIFLGLGPLAAQQPIHKHYYRIINKRSHFCLTVAGKAMGDHALIEQRPCHGGPNQSWFVRYMDRDAIRLAAQHSDRCMDVPGKSRRSGLEMQQFRCHDGWNQQWYLHELKPGGYEGYRLISRINGLCLEVSGASRIDGAPVIQTRCIYEGEISHQVWLFK